MNIKNITTILFSALSLGLAWAIRGSFGHEYGAAWAGAIGTFAVVVISRNKNWISNAPVLTALGALGWGVGGMSSYGVVIGYCRSIDLLNVLYGYLMLFVIGGIYGFIGGGFFGLGLESEKNKRPNWANLITQMTAGAMLTWGFIIYQLEWFMTPPRSELWAAAFGASLALGWYLWREDFKQSLRIALFTCVGAGIGFSFGNFIQVVGSVSGINYNWWNVMEFILGFSGGIALTYSVFTSGMNKQITFSKSSNFFAFIFLFIILPFINFDQSFSFEYFNKLSSLQTSLSGNDFSILQIGLGWLMILIISVLAFITLRKFESTNNSKYMNYLFTLIFLYYNVFLIIRNGLFYSGFELSNSNTLYIPIFAVIILLLYQSKYELKNSISDNPMLSKQLITFAVSALVVIIILSIISINLHNGLPGAQLRFQ